MQRQIHAHVAVWALTSELVPLYYVNYKIVYTEFCAGALELQCSMATLMVCLFDVLLAFRSFKNRERYCRQHCHR